jgi:hypothetical protein
LQERARATHGLGVGRAGTLALAQRADRVEVGAVMAGTRDERTIEPARRFLGTAGFFELRAVVAARARVRRQELRGDALMAQRRVFLAGIDLVAVDREVRLGEHRRGVGHREQVAPRIARLAEVREHVIASRREVIGIEREQTLVDDARIVARQIVERAQKRDTQARRRREHLLGDDRIGILVGGRRRRHRAIEPRRCQPQVTLLEVGQPRRRWQAARREPRLDARADALVERAVDGGPHVLGDARPARAQCDRR